MEDASSEAGGASPRVVCIILPALNEERSIAQVLRRIPRESLQVLGYTPRVLVVDGHSVDATLRIAVARGAEIVVQRGKGKGNAIREVHELLLDETWTDAGLGNEPRHYVVLDADCTYPPETIADLVAALDSGYDVVLASRFLGIIHPGAMTELNRIGNRLLTRLFRILNGVDLTDSCTGMYAFNERVFRNLSLEAEGFDVEADLFTSACIMNARIAEVPVDYARRVGEAKLVPLRSGIRIGLRMLRRRVRGVNGRGALSDAPRRSPHPFIAWTGRLREPSASQRLSATRRRPALGQLVAALGRQRAAGWLMGSSRRT